MSTNIFTSLFPRNLSRKVSTWVEGFEPLTVKDFKEHKYNVLDRPFAKMLFDSSFPDKLVKEFVYCMDHLDEMAKELHSIIGNQNIIVDNQLKKEDYPDFQTICLIDPLGNLRGWDVVDNERIHEMMNEFNRFHYFRILNFVFSALKTTSLSFKLDNQACTIHLDYVSNDWVRNYEFNGAYLGRLSYFDNENDIELGILFSLDHFK